MNGWHPGSEYAADYAAENADLRARLAAVEAVCADACHLGNHIDGVSVVSIPKVRHALRGESS